MNVQHRLIRMKEVVSRTGISRTTIYELLNRGSFPAQVVITARSVAFVEAEIDQWIADRMNARA